jgi:hypothetical protein
MFTAPVQARAMKKVAAACLMGATLGGCTHAVPGRPEAAGPPLRLGAWRLVDERGALPLLCVDRLPRVTQVIFRVGQPICMASFRWRRETKNTWRFESTCAVDGREQVGDGRATGDFETSFAFTARVRSRGFDDPPDGEGIVHVEARYAGPTC